MTSRSWLWTPTPKEDFTLERFKLNEKDSKETIERRKDSMLKLLFPASSRDWESENFSKWFSCRFKSESFYRWDWSIRRPFTGRNFPKHLEMSRPTTLRLIYRAAHLTTRFWWVNFINFCWRTCSTIAVLWVEIWDEKIFQNLPSGTTEIII